MAKSDLSADVGVLPPVRAWMLEIIYASWERGRNCVQAGDSLSMPDSDSPGFRASINMVVCDRQGKLRSIIKYIMLIM